MPELPEVETVRLDLLKNLRGRRIRQVEVARAGQIRYPDVETFRHALEGAAFQAIQRRGKYLIFELSGGLTLVAHLRMSGRLVFVADPAALPRPPHTHVVFHLHDGSELRYTDMRTFGGFHLLGPGGEGLPAGLANLGPEPLSGDFTPQYLAEKLAGRRASIKAALLDQALVAGLGNIYADEALYAAGIHPEREGASLSPEETARLYGAVCSVLQKALAWRGTSFSMYLDGNGQAGGFVQYLQVFRRTGEPCPACGTPVARRKVAGRSSHFCPQCQR